MPAKRAAAPKKPRAPRKVKAAPGSRGLGAIEVSQAGEGSSKLAAEIAADGGAVLARYREPLGGHDVVLAALPLEKVAPTPYQRDLSETHVKKLTVALGKLDRYLDPIIAVRHGETYWTPNGNHRLATLRGLGAKSIVALVVPEPEVAFQILALNTEKAHNLKERSLEVIRMERGMVADAPERHELEAAGMLEEPAFATLGACYEKRPRFSGGAYQPIVKRCEAFFDLPLREALAKREQRAEELLAIDDAVIEKVAALKAQGLESPYLKGFVVARANPIRFAKAASFEWDATMAKMLAALGKMDLSKVKREDVARAGGYAGSTEGEE